MAFGRRCGQEAAPPGGFHRLTRETEPPLPTRRDRSHASTGSDFICNAGNHTIGSVPTCEGVEVAAGHRMGAISVTHPTFIHPTSTLTH